MKIWILNRASAAVAHELADRTNRCTSRKGNEIAQPTNPENKKMKKNMPTRKIINNSLFSSFFFFFLFFSLFFLFFFCFYLEAQSGKIDMPTRTVADYQKYYRSRHDFIQNRKGEKEKNKERTEWQRMKTWAILKTRTVEESEGILNPRLCCGRSRVRELHKSLHFSKKGIEVAQPTNPENWNMKKNMPARNVAELTKYHRARHVFYSRKTSGGSMKNKLYLSLLITTDRF